MSADKTSFAQASLRIGDTVLFYFRSAKEENGYIYSELSSSPYNVLNVLPTKSRKEKEPGFSNINFAVFKVLAPNKYKAKQYQNELEQRKSEEYEISNAKRAVESENAENEQEQARRLGSKVVYGDLIQFQHIGSKKYVTVCSEASKTESNNLLVNLSVENSEGAIFKILPRYKVRSEGDGVHYDDHIKLESMKTPGQFLHVGTRSQGKAGYKVLPDCLEVNLSATESAFTLICHYSESAKHPKKALRGGKAVRLFHKEDECYIVAEGSFASSSPVLENVHCRMRRVDSRKHSLPSTSSNTYWQIEKVDDPRSGDILSWGETCRLRHLPTRMYLSVNSELQVVLKHRSFEDESDNDTLFSFHALIEEGEEVLLESYACIKHLLSGEWLHLEKKEPYTKSSFNPDAEGLAGLQWDSAELYKLKTSKDRGDYDSFTLQEVSENLLDIFNYVAGIVPVLSTHIKDIDEDGIVSLVTEKEASRIKKTLYELRKWLLTDYETETKNRQKLLRNLLIIEQLAEILRSGNCEEIKPSQKEICRECYNVIKCYLEGDSRKNENYLAKFIENFQEHIRKELNAEEVLVEIVQDNINIVSKMAETRMSHMIYQFCSTRDPRFLIFLSSLCVCNDRPIPSTQARLLKELVLERGKNMFLRLTVEEVEDEQIVFYHMPGQEGTARSIRKLNSQEEARNRTLSKGEKVVHEGEVNDFNLLEAQLYLFSKLCKGNNKEAIDALLYDPQHNPDGYIDFSQALQVVEDEKVDITLRRRYVEIIMVMFVDVGENRSFLDNLCYSFVYDEIVAKPYADTGGEEGETIALTGVENKHFPVLKSWILDTLVAHNSLCSGLDSELENAFLEQVLDVLSYLVRYGYYDDIDDVDDCMKPLIQLLDGFSDVPSIGRQGSPEDVKIYREIERQKNLADNKSVFAVKVKALEVMELFFRFKFYVKLQKFIYDFKVLHGEGRRTIQGKEKIKTTIEDTAPPRILSQLISKPGESDEWLHQPHMTHAVRGRIQFLCDNEYFEQGCGFAPMDDSIPSLESVLLDLSGYECDELVSSSLNLLMMMYYFKEELFGKAAQVQLLIAPQSIQDFQLVNDEILPELRQLLRVDANQRIQDRIVQLLTKLSELCVVPSTIAGEIEPNEENQLMLDNQGIVSEVLSFVLSKGLDGQGPKTLPGTKKDTDDSVNVREEVYSACFGLLSCVAAGNKRVQRRLFNRIDDLLELKVPGNALAGVADLLTEVFTGGPELMLKVSESHVEKIFEIIVNSQSSKVQAEFMVTLQAMAKIEELDLPVGRNQALIVKNFCRLRHTFCEEIIAEKEGMDLKRMELLMDDDEDSSLLQVLLSVTDLLAACAESKNRFIESVCQNIFSIEELLSIMTQSDLLPVRKRPFVRFFILVYMQHGTEKLGNQSSVINHGSEMWHYLEHVGSLLMKIANFFREVPFEERASMSQELVSSGRRSGTLSPLATERQPLHQTLSVKMKDVTDQHGHIIPGLLEYIADGVVPLLHIFYSTFFNPKDAGNSKQADREYEISLLIAKSLAQLSQELAKVFSSESKLVIYKETLEKLLEHERIAKASDIDESVVFSLMHQQSVESSVQPKTSKKGTLIRSTTIDSTVNVISPLPVSAFSDYQQQQLLNIGFHYYSQNFLTVYRGRNTAAFQILSPVQDIEYSDKGEELPLGPSFQHLVSLYLVNPSAGETSVRVKKEVENLLRQLEISHSSTEQLSESDQIIQELLDIRCLQVLRALIINKIKLIDPELKDRNPGKFRQKFDQLVVPVQNQLQDFNNAIRRITPLLSHPNENISRESLAFMKVLLFSGNKQVQGGLSGSVQETREEALFLNLKRRIEIASLNYKETKDLETQLAVRQEIRLQSGLGKESGKKTDTLPSSSHTKAAKALSDVEKKSSINRAVAISMDDLGNPDAGADDKAQLVSSFSGTSKGNVDTLPGPSVSAEDKKNDDKEDEFLLGDVLVNDNTWTTLVLEVVGLMCDGQHRTLQNYLRDQPDNFKTVNVVAEVTSFLHTYASYLSSENLGHINKVLQSLIEMCVGNIKNQQVVLDKLIVEPLNRILQIPLPTTSHQCTTENCPECEHILDLTQVKGSAVELISIMLEEIDQESSQIAKGVGSSLNETAIIETMHFFHTMRGHPLVRRNQMDDDCERGMYRAYHILKSLIDFNESSFKSIENMKKEVQSSRDLAKSKEALNECIQQTKTIEIHFNENDSSKSVLTRVNFPFDPEETLREAISEKVRWNINRDSMEDKQRALLDLLPAMKSDISHQIKLKKTKILRPILAYHTLRIYFLMFLTVLLNLFVLFTYTVPSDSVDSDDSNFNTIAATPKWFDPYILYILGTVHLIFSFWIVVEYFLINWPHFQLPKFLYASWYEILRIVLRERNFRQLPRFTFLDVNIFGIKTVYMLVFLLCSILSLVFRGYFYCVCLLFIIITNDILQRVLRAVTKHGNALIWVAVLGTIVLFIYAVVSFAWLHGYFDPSDGLFCDTLAQCMYSVLRVGLLDTLGSSVPLYRNGSSMEYSYHLPVRLIYDLSFFVIVTTIGLNIVFGIIVDSFGELREERSNVEAEQKSKCFVCDLPSYDFERKAKGFKNHVKFDHNMWDYVYYSMYIDNIDTGDHNAVQKYVYEKIANNDTGFFPQEEAHCLAGDDDTTSEKLEELQEKIEGILQRFRDKDFEKNLRAKKTHQRQFEANLKARQFSVGRANTDMSSASGQD